MTALPARLGRRVPAVVWWGPSDEWRSTPAPVVRGLLSGSFNPLHEGHRRLRDVASALLEGRVAYELSAVNADKPPLEPSEIERRCRQFGVPAEEGLAEHPLVAVTNAATFLEKSRLFPQVTFVVGADTALRIVDPKFYQDDPSLMDDGLKRIGECGCTFLVAARRWRGCLLTLDEVPIPSEHRSLFREIPAKTFCLDVSSSDLRQSS